MAEFQNTLYTGDNLYVLYGLNSNLADLIYLDPPFNSKRMYSAPVGSRAAGASFKDMWEWKDVDEYYLGKLAINYPALAHYIAGAGAVHSKAMMAYLTYMAQRVIEMHRVLKDTGSLYLHCDPTASHYLKLLLDSIFGKNNFGNDISWCYTGPSGAKKRFPAKHDVILRYTKSENYVFNADAVRIPYDTATLERRSYSETKQRGIPFQGKNIEEYESGKIPSDWWYDIPSGGQISSKERTGYPTQKPLALLHRIVKASSNEGDIVLDPFCGCATTCVAAQQLGRKWIGIDIEKQPVKILIDRLSDDAGMFKDFIATDKLPVRTDIQAIAPDSKSVKERLYREQNGLCNGCGHEFDIWNLEIDHIVPKSKGGGSYYENYQLLCGACNKKKGDRPMEYLRMQIETRNKLLKQRILFGE
ncbi:MAG: adenine-specific DNA-methyltransferase [Treponematales bacterium]